LCIDEDSYSGYWRGEVLVMVDRSRRQYPYRCSSLPRVGNNSEARMVYLEQKQWGI